MRRFVAISCWIGVLISGDLAALLGHEADKGSLACVLTAIWLIISTFLSITIL